MKKKSCWPLVVGRWEIPSRLILNSSPLRFKLSTFCFLLFAFCFPLPTEAQTDIPIGSWRLHLSYNTITSIAIGNNQIFGAAESGIMVYNKTDNSIASYNTLNGLTGTGISHIAFDPANNQLLVGYSDGNLDIISDNEVINFNRLKNITEVSGSKAIHHIAVKNNFAYLATDYGVVVFDLLKHELKETWRDLSNTGKNLKILESTFIHDSIFLATEKGVMAGNLNANLLDFNNWKRFDTGDFATSVQSVTTFNNKVYAAINGKNIYRFKNGSWIKESFLTGATFHALSATPDHLLITEGSKLWRLNTSNSLEAIETSVITTPHIALADDQGNFWIGDENNGLISNITGTFQSYVPNGPAISSAFRLKYYDGKLFALAGGFSNVGNTVDSKGGLATFTNGIWESAAPAIQNLTDIDFMNNEVYLSSFGEGVERIDEAGNKIIFDHTNSPLVKTDPTTKSVNVTSLARSANGLWVTNFGASQSLHLLNNGAWQSFGFSETATRYPIDMAVDYSENVWLALDPVQGGGVLFFNKSSNTSSYITEVPGRGALPSRNVRSIAADNDGNIWVGTDLGVAYFFTATADAVKPIFENRFLLRDEKITAIEIDGGNRKWIGTERGIWLFSPTGETLILNFTTSNSPLLSNNIRDIEINEQTGEVFFSTDKGILSYRGDATGATQNFQSLKIFPNPVTSDFAGTVGITGLAANAIVKITDVNGRLIWQTQANGGTAAWNVRDYNGRRAATGIYLVFAATEDGAESVVGKIAVVN